MSLLLLFWIILLTLLKTIDKSVLQRYSSLDKGVFLCLHKDLAV